MSWLGKLVNSMKVHKEFYIKTETAKTVILSLTVSVVYMVYFLGARLKILAGITEQ